MIIDDGTVWLASEDKVETYKGNTPKIYAYPGELGPAPDRNIMGLIMHRDVVKFIVQDLADIERCPLTLLFDTKTRKHEKLPVISEYQSLFDIKYVPDSLQFYDSGRFTGSCTLDPKIQRQFKIDPFESGKDMSLSPDGNRLLEYKADFQNVQITLKDKSATRSGKDQDYHSVLQSNIIFFADEEEEDEIVIPEKKKKRRKKSINVGKRRANPVDQFVEVDPRSLDFFWLSNDIVIAMHQKRISVRHRNCCKPYILIIKFYF